MRTIEQSKSKLLKTIATAVFIFVGVSITILSLEYLLFKTPDFNIYRVLDNSTRSIVIMLFFLTVQYAYFRKMPLYIKALKDFIPQKYRIGLLYIALPLLGLAMYNLFPSNYESWIFFVVLGSFIGYSFLASKAQKAPFARILLTLLFAAGLNASLIFWMHEETNKEIHFQYARQLAEPIDTIAEKNILQLVSIDTNLDSNISAKTFWEKQYLENDYLASNYYLG